MKKITLALAFLLISTSAYSEKIVFAGLLKEDINQSGVAEIGIRYSEAGLLYGSGSLMWFVHEDNLYNGINASIGLNYGTDLKLYAGVGGFFGEYEACESVGSDGTKKCDSDYTGGLYPELALQMPISKFRVSAYTRYYRTFDAGNNEYTMIGMFIGYEM